MTKICMLAEGLPPAFGGAARQALRLAAELRNRGVAIWFAASQIVEGSPSKDTIDGFAVYRVPYAVSSPVTRLRALIGFCTLFFKKRREFDILHLHGAYYLTLGVAYVMKKVLGKKILIKLTLLGCDTPQGVRQNRYGRLAWFFYRHADAFICMSSALYDECRRYGLPEARLHKIPNGVDVRRYRPCVSEQEYHETLARLGLSAEFQYATFIGAIERRKGIDLLVETVARVHPKHPDVKFLLIGPNGSSQKESWVDAGFVSRIRDQIQAAGLNEHVLLLGEKTNAEEYLRVATFFLFPSRAEGFGTALIEAMASGLPCVALNIAGVTSDIITSNQNGIIIEREDPAAFAAAILGLVEDKALRTRLGAQARATVLDRFDFPMIARHYASLYETVLSST